MPALTKIAALGAIGLSFACVGAQAADKVKVGLVSTLSGPSAALGVNRPRRITARQSRGRPGPLRRAVAPKHAWRAGFAQAAMADIGAAQGCGCPRRARLARWVRS